MTASENAETLDIGCPHDSLQRERVPCRRLVEAVPFASQLTHSFCKVP
jgi:hypothetical protein